MPYSDAVKETFLRALSTAIKASGISAAEVAKRAGMAPTTLRSQLSGASRELPDPPQVFVLEAVLDLRPGQLSQHLGYLPVAPGAPLVKGVLDALAADELLDEGSRETLADVYRSAVRRSKQSALRSSSSSSGSRAAAAAKSPPRTR